MAVQRYKHVTLATGESTKIKIRAHTDHFGDKSLCKMERIYIHWGHFNFSEGIKLIMRRYINVIDPNL